MDIQMFDCQRTTALADAACGAASALTMIAGFIWRGKVGCHTSAVEKREPAVYFPQRRGGREEEMKNSGLSLAVVVLSLVQVCLGQDLGQDVDDLTLESPSATLTRLSWAGPRSVDCEAVVTYSVFRGTKENFTPSVANRVASGLTKTTYLAKEPVASRDYYYSVKANVTPVSCALRSGEIRVYPPDLGETFSVTVGENTATCSVHLISEISCPRPLPDFHVAMASQGKHEYLIGCQDADYEGGAWTCVNLTTGVYHVEVHSRTLTVWDSGMAKINVDTGKKVASITPLFSVLARIR